MTEIRVFCDVCHDECTEDFYSIDIYNHREDETYAVKEPLQVCHICFTRINAILRADVCEEVNQDF